MKATITIILFILIHSSHAHLINSYGLKVGMTNSKEKWDYQSEFPSDFKTDSKIGLNISVFVQSFDLPFFNLVTEIGYNQKGMEVKVEKTTISEPEGTGEFITINNRVDYLDLSLSAKFNYSMPGITPYFFVGPRMSLLIGSNSNFGYNVVYDDFKNVVYGLKIGIGSEIRNILPFAVLIEAQYNYDLSDSYKRDLLKINNNSFEIKVGIIL